MLFPMHLKGNSMSYTVTTITGLTLQAHEDPPAAWELDHSDFTADGGVPGWDLWEAPQGWDCRFLRHLSTGLLYHDEDLYLIGWLDPDTEDIDLFDAPLDE
jgi:hypothetical protein